MANNKCTNRIKSKTTIKGYEYSYPFVVLFIFIMCKKMRLNVIKIYVRKKHDEMIEEILLQAV